MSVQKNRRDNLEKWLKSKKAEGYSVSKLCDKFPDLPEASYISQLKNGHRSFGESSARNIEKAVGLPELFFDRPLDIQSMGELKKEKIFVWDDETVFPDDMIPIDFKKDVIFQSGAGGQIVPDNEGRKLMMSVRTLEAHNIDARNVFATTNQGDSNAPEILSGDTIWIDQSKKKIVADEFYAINHAGNLRIKLLDKVGGQLRIRSHNDDKETYPDEFYKVDELLENEIHIIGWLFSWQRIRRWKW